jgi:chorismate synthase
MGRLRFMTGGESHGPECTAFLEGVPAGVSLLAEHINGDLRRRQRGYGRGARMKIEMDEVTFLGGVRHGETLGSPVVLAVKNRDYENWRTRMGPQPLAVLMAEHRTDGAKLDPATQNGGQITRPRPGHADLAGGLKYNRKDLRDILERASARETAARVAAGAVARRMLAELGIEVFAHVVQIGGVTTEHTDAEYSKVRASAQDSDLSCADPIAAAAMRSAIQQAAHEGDTLGGVFEVVALGVPPGLGSHVQWDRKLDGRLAQALMSIQAIKGVEIGVGFAAAVQPGSLVHDAIGYDPSSHLFRRPTNRAGGLEGGISNGEAIVCRAAMKPIATLKKPLPSVDIETKEAFQAAYERSDVCAVPAAGVVGEAMVLLTLADAILEKFGGDCMQELKRNVATFLAQTAEY